MDLFILAQSCINYKQTTFNPANQHIIFISMKPAGLWRSVIGGDARDVTGAVRPVFWQWEKFTRVLMRHCWGLSLTGLNSALNRALHDFILMSSGLSGGRQYYLTSGHIISISTGGLTHEPRQDRNSLIDQVHVLLQQSSQQSDFSRDVMEQCGLINCGHFWYCTSIRLASQTLLS